MPKKILDNTGLSYLLTKIKNNFIEKPTTGSTGQVLKKTSTGVEWGTVSGNVASVNGKTGTVSLTASDVSATDVANGFSTRFSSDYNYLNEVSNAYHVFGDIYSITFGNKTLPTNIGTSTSNVMTETDIIDLTGNAQRFKKFIPSINIDTHVYSNNAFTRQIYFPTFNMTLQIRFTDSTTKNIVVRINSLTNNTVHNLSAYLTTAELAKQINRVTVSQLAFTGEYRNHAGTVVTVSGTPRNIAHNGFILFESY